MKFNPDCIRDILFSIEEVSTINSVITSERLSKSSFLSKYSEDEILYHLNQLDLSGYIITPERNFFDNLFLVNDLSPAGHEFISNIRKDTSWNKVKVISKEVGVTTLTSLKTIAELLVTSGIQTYFGLS